jgi:hypothetical protein
VVYLREMTKPEIYDKLLLCKEELSKFTPDDDLEFLRWCEELWLFLGSHEAKDHFDIAMLKACLGNRIKEIPIYRKEAGGEWTTERLFASMINDTQRSIDMVFKGTYFRD